MSRACGQCESQTLQAGLVIALDDQHSLRGLVLIWLPDNQAAPRSGSPRRKVLESELPIPLPDSLYELYHNASRLGSRFSTSVQNTPVGLGRAVEVARSVSDSNAFVSIVSWPVDQGCFRNGVKADTARAWPPSSFWSRLTETTLIPSSSTFGWGFWPDLLSWERTCGMPHPNPKMISFEVHISRTEVLKSLQSALPQPPAYLRRSNPLNSWFYCRKWNSFLASASFVLHSWVSIFDSRGEYSARLNSNKCQHRRDKLWSSATCTKRRWRPLPFARSPMRFIKVNGILAHRYFSW